MYILFTGCWSCTVRPRIPAPRIPYPERHGIGGFTVEIFYSQAVEVAEGQSDTGISDISGAGESPFK